MEDQVAEFLKKGGEIEQLDIREAKLKAGYNPLTTDVVNKKNGGDK